MTQLTGDGLPPLSPPAMAARLAAVAGVVGAVVVAFAYLGGWLTPGKVTPAKFADVFEQNDGRHPGFRRNHAKGLGVSGYFDGNGQGQRLSAAAVFANGRTPVLGRFSLSGGNPYAIDSSMAVRGLGLRFTPAAGGEWRTAMISLPVFPLSTPTAFYDLLVASHPVPATGKPDPAAMGAFAAAHPELGRATAIIKAQPVASGFDNTTFHGLDAFRFTAADGTTRAVRWEFVPDQPFSPATQPTTGPADPNALFDALAERIGRGPLRWHLVLIVAQPSDPTADPSVPWPADRERVDAGTLTLDRAESDETSAARDLNFDPLVLPSGMGPSDDPFPSARSAVYSKSFTRREGEPPGRPAVTPADLASHAKG